MKYGKMFVIWPLEGGDGGQIRVWYPSSQPYIKTWACRISLDAK